MIGNVEKENVNISDYNHAWVMVEIAPFQWIACEVTGGYVVLMEDNPLYYRGVWFENPLEFKEYISTLNALSFTLDEITDLLSLSSECLEKWKEEYLLSPPTSDDEIKEAYQKLGKCEGLVDYLKAKRLEVELLKFKLNNIGEFVDLRA